MMSDHIVPKRVYYTIFAHPDALHATSRCRSRSSTSARSTPSPRSTIAVVQGHARRAVLHAREVQHAPHLGGRRRQRLLARDPAGADVGRLPDARVAHLRLTRGRDHEDTKNTKTHEEDHCAQAHRRSEDHEVFLENNS